MASLGMTLTSWEHHPGIRQAVTQYPLHPSPLSRRRRSPVIAVWAPARIFRFV